MYYGDNTAQYFCCACSSVYIAGYSRLLADMIPQDDKIHDSICDLHLVCQDCGTAHRARRFPGDDFYKRLFAQREPLIRTITPDDLAWHTKQEAERAIRNLRSPNIAENEAFLRAWRTDTKSRRHLNLLPKTAGQKRWEYISEGVMLVVWIPTLLMIFVVSVIKSLPNLLPSARRRHELQRQQNRQMTIEVVRADTAKVQATFVDVASISLPERKINEYRPRYIGYELDTPSNPTDPFETALNSLVCGDCGRRGTMTRRISTGMVCPRCHSDTLEESREQQEQRNALWA